MRTRPREKLTLEDLYELPDDGTRYELRQGWLVSEPAPGGRHGWIEAALGARMTQHARENRGGVVLHNASYVLSRNPDTVRVPDISVVGRKRYLALADQAAPIPGPPDLAVEILSPSDRPGSMREKIDDYLDAGTQLVWLIDPAARSAARYTPLRNAEPVRALIGEPVLQGFYVPLDEILDFWD